MGFTKDDKIIIDNIDSMIASFKNIRNSIGKYNIEDESELSCYNSFEPQLNRLKAELESIVVNYDNYKKNTTKLAEIRLQEKFIIPDNEVKNNNFEYEAIVSLHKSTKDEIRNAQEALAQAFSKLNEQGAKIEQFNVE